ncbi:MAG TPA: helix-turn-helix domain-containing protein [Pseudonocardiaceae bacterium]|jgi:TetR/AcrR family transcriptional regulator|nr:helix-turn-helix domain-containing protein [Pseudonocardiaceae bacterium]
MRPKLDPALEQPSHRPTRGSARRSPSREERQRDPERTRERILQAAKTEFGDYGYAGARVSRIAARAGVNAQLISYYFDGKAGLYQALLSQWREVTADLSRPDRPLNEIVAGFARAAATHRWWIRLLVWQALGDSPDYPDTHAGLGTSGVTDPDCLGQQVVELRRRQDAGELAADLEPAHLLLALFAAASAPTVLPHIARRIVGADPASEEFLATYTDQVARLVRHLEIAPL